MSLQCLYNLGVITYFQLNRDYIANVLCINKEEPITMCYGQCFLDRNLDLPDNDNSEEGPAPTREQRTDFPVFLIAETHYGLGGESPPGRGNCFYIPGTSSEHSSVPFHPPTVLS